MVFHLVMGLDAVLSSAESASPPRHEASWLLSPATALGRAKSQPRQLLPGQSAGYDPSGSRRRVVRLLGLEQSCQAWVGFSAPLFRGCPRLSLSFPA